MSARAAGRRWPRSTTSMPRHGVRWVARRVLTAGPDGISLKELEQALARVRDELLEVYNPEDYEAVTMADVKRAVARARDEMLLLHDGNPELIDREQLQARVLELIDLYSKAPIAVHPDTGEWDYDLRA